jgi:hypothetical protein
LTDEEDEILEVVTRGTVDRTELGTLGAREGLSPFNATARSVSLKQQKV